MTVTNRAEYTLGSSAKERSPFFLAIIYAEIMKFAQCLPAFQKFTFKINMYPDKEKQPRKGLAYRRRYNLAPPNAKPCATRITQIDYQKLGSYDGRLTMTQI